MESYTGAPSSLLRHAFLALGACLLLALVVFLNPPPPAAAGEDASFRIGHIVGALMAPLFVVAVVYGVMRFVRRRKTPLAFVTVAFWTLVVVAGLQVLSAIGRMPK